MEGVALEKCSRELGADLECERIDHGVLQLYEPLHNFEMPASGPQQSSDTLGA